jgi:hypothetical protein
VLARLGEGTAVDFDDPRFAAAGASLCERGLLENSHLDTTGESVYRRALAARREGLADLLEGWAPDEHDEARAMLNSLARELVAEPPALGARVT